MVSGVATFPGMKDAMDQLDRIWRVSIDVISCKKYIAIVSHEKLNFTSSQLSWINLILHDKFPTIWAIESGLFWAIFIMSSIQKKIL